MADSLERRSVAVIEENRSRIMALPISGGTAPMHLSRPDGADGSRSREVDEETTISLSDVTIYRTSPFRLPVAQRAANVLLRKTSGILATTFSYRSGDGAVLLNVFRLPV